MSVVAKSGDGLLAAIRELAAYRCEDPVATAFNVGNSFFATNELWRARNPRTSAEIMQHYRESVPGVAQQVFATYGIPGEIALRARIAQLVQRGERVLDFGAGIGSQLLPLGGNGRKLTHVDVGGVQAEYAAWRYKSRGMDVKMIDLPDDYMAGNLSLGGPFDTVICTEVIEHVLDPVALVALLAALVRPGGRCIATTSFHDHDGMVPMHLNVGTYTDEQFASEVFPRYGLTLVEPSVYRKSEG